MFNALKFYTLNFSDDMEFAREMFSRCESLTLSDSDSFENCPRAESNTSNCITADICSDETMGICSLR